MPTTDATDFYRKPYLTTAAYALGLLLFLLPFFDIKCNNIPMAWLTGVDMATGGRPDLSREMIEVQRGISDKNTDDISAATKDGAQGKLFITALIALALGVTGLILSLVSKSRNKQPAMVVGILGALALIGSWIQISSYVKDNARPQAGRNNVDAPFSSMINVAASPTFWFILCLLCYLAAAYFSYKQTGLRTETDAPPQTAPQLNIGNPGDQSEFPAAPQGERDLG